MFDKIRKFNLDTNIFLGHKINVIDFDLERYYAEYHGFEKYANLDDNNIKLRGFYDFSVLNCRYSITSEKDKKQTYLMTLWVDFELYLPGCDFIIKNYRDTFNHQYLAFLIRNENKLEEETNVRKVISKVCHEILNEDLIELFYV
jgi:hypothetical protein